MVMVAVVVLVSAAVFVSYGNAQRQPSNGAGYVMVSSSLGSTRLHNNDNVGGGASGNGADNAVDHHRSEHRHLGHNFHHYRLARSAAASADDTVDAGKSNYRSPRPLPRRPAQDTTNEHRADDHGSRIQRRAAVVDEHLIVNFLKTYKHINVATLLVCPSTPLLKDDSNDNEDDNVNVNDGEYLDDYFSTITASTTDRQQTTKTCCCCTASAPLSRPPSLIASAKRLMAAGILITASDIDSFRGGYAGGGGAAVAVNSSRSRRCSRSCSTRRTNGKSCCTDAVVALLPNMLKCGTFKQAIVLDLTCRSSKLVLQQVCVKNPTSWSC